MLGETPLPAQQAQQAAGGTQQQGGGGPGQTLARSLLAVAEADRQRIQVLAFFYSFHLVCNCVLFAGGVGPSAAAGGAGSSCAVLFTP